MLDSLFSMFKMSWPPIATWVGSSLAVTQLEIDPDVIYPLLAALALAVWRAATFVKGVQEAIRAADADRQEMAERLEKIYTKINVEGKKLAVIEAGCPLVKGVNDCAIKRNHD